MKEIKYTRAADRQVTQETTGGDVDLTPLAGTWINTNRSTGEIRKFILAKKAGDFTFHAFAVDSPFDWGPVQVTVHAGSIGSRDPVAFSAIYDFGFMESFLAANTNKGLIIIAAYNKFKDNSRRSNYFSREFYFREQ